MANRHCGDGSTLDIKVISANQPISFVWTGHAACDILYIAALCSPVDASCCPGCAAITCMRAVLWPISLLPMSCHRAGDQDRQAAVICTDHHL